MSVLFVVVPIALVLVAVAIVAFVWSVNRGQFDDLVTPAVRALHDDPPAMPAQEIASEEDESPPSGAASHRSPRIV